MRNSALPLASHAIEATSWGAEHVLLRTSDVTLHLSGPLRLTDERGDLVGQWNPDQGGEDAAARFVTLLPREVQECVVSEDGTLTLTFANGATLTDLPEVGPYETWYAAGTARDGSTWYVRCEPGNPRIFLDILGTVELPWSR